MEAKIDKFMNLVFELKQDVVALKEKSSSGSGTETNPDVKPIDPIVPIDPVNKTWTVTVPKVGATANKTVTYKLTATGKDKPVSSYTVGSDQFSFEITAPQKPTIFSVSYDSETISSGITVTEKQQ